MSDQEVSRKPRTNWLRNCCGCSVLLLLLVVGRYFTNQQLPVVNVPLAHMPSLNAFDDFVAAGQAMLESNKVGYAISDRHEGKGDDHAYSLADKQKLVSENVPALNLMRQGLPKDYASPPARSLGAVFPYYSKFRGLARLIRLDAMVKASRGEFDRAVQSDLDAVELGEKIPHQSVLIGGLVGIACQAIGRRDIWTYSEHLTAPEALEATKRLRRIDESQVPYAETLTQEKWSFQAGLQEMLRSNQVGVLEMLNSDIDWNPAISSAADRAMFLVYSKRQIMANYSNYMDRTIERVRLPYLKGRPLPKAPADPITAQIFGEFDQGQIHFLRTVAENRLLEITLALHAFKLVHGSYPTALSELTPTWLRSGIMDPFSVSQPFHYRRDGSRYLLYSVGPDGKDDGGRPIDNKSADPKQTPSSRYRIAADSNGDIVAGINIY